MEVHNNSLTQNLLKCEILLELKSDLLFEPWWQTCYELLIIAIQFHAAWT